MDKKSRENKYKSDYKLRKRAELRLQVLEYLLAHPCITCGEKDPIVLEFDHREQETKVAGVATLVNDCVAWEIIQAEIDKCDVLCANCHRRRTAFQLGYWKQI